MGFGPMLYLLSFAPGGIPWVDPGPGALLPRLGLSMDPVTSTHLCLLWPGPAGLCEVGSVSPKKHHQEKSGKSPCTWL